MGLFRKKDGTPTFLGKAAGTVVGINAAVAKAVVPAFTGVDGDKVQDTMHKFYGGLGIPVKPLSAEADMVIGKVIPGKGEKLTDYKQRMTQAAGAAVGGFMSKVDKPYNDKNPYKLDPFKKGYFDEAYIKEYLPFILGGVAIIAGAVVYIKKK